MGYELHSFWTWRVCPKSLGGRDKADFSPLEPLLISHALRAVATAGNGVSPALSKHTKHLATGKKLDHLYKPRTQMTIVFTGKGLVWGVWPSNIEVIGALGMSYFVGSFFPQVMVQWHNCLGNSLDQKRTCSHTTLDTSEPKDLMLTQNEYVYVYLFIYLFIHLFIYFSFLFIHSCIYLFIN